MTDAYDKIAEAVINDGRTMFHFDTEVQPLMKLYRKLVLNLRDAAETRAKGGMSEHAFFNRIQELAGYALMSGDAPLVPRPDHGVSEETLRQVGALSDRRTEIRQLLSEGTITREEAHQEFPETF